MATRDGESVDGQVLPAAGGESVQPTAPSVAMNAGPQGRLDTDLKISPCQREETDFRYRWRGGGGIGVGAARTMGLVRRSHFGTLFRGVCLCT